MVAKKLEEAFSDGVDVFLDDEPIDLAQELDSQTDDKLTSDFVRTEIHRDMLKSHLDSSLSHLLNADVDDCAPVQELLKFWDQAQGVGSTKVTLICAHY